MEAVEKMKHAAGQLNAAMEEWWVDGTLRNAAIYGTGGLPMVAACGALLMECGAKSRARPMECGSFLFVGGA